LWGQPLLKILGSRGALARQFIARFLGCGPARRPKYEVMGLQDMSHGLYEANVSEVNLTWVGDEAHCRAYHWLEDVYRLYREFLACGALVHRAVADSHAWWAIEHAATWLVGVVCWDTTTFDLDLAEVAPGAEGSVVAYDFQACRATPASGRQVHREVSQPPCCYLFAISSETKRPHLG
jgi:hypothetical protein